MTSAETGRRDRSDTPTTWDERTTLTTFLDYVRATAVAKCEGLTDEQARGVHLPSSPLTTAAGLLSHLRWTEYFWFRVMFLGETDEGPWTEEDPDRDMRLGQQIPLAQLVAEYNDQATQYRELVTSRDLDAPAARSVSTGDHPTLRWVLTHLIEETARHNGHLDLLRELTDGRTGA